MKFLKIENSFLNIIEDSNDLERTLDKEKEFFSKEILFHESKNKLNDNFIESVYSEILISKEKLDIFLSYLFYKNNIKHVFHRVGDVNLRSDMILQSNNNVGLVEIEKGNNLLDPPRNILEQYALLKSRSEFLQNNVLTSSNLWFSINSTSSELIFSHSPVIPKLPSFKYLPALPAICPISDKFSRLSFFPSNFFKLEK